MKRGSDLEVTLGGPWGGWAEERASGFDGGDCICPIPYGHSHALQIWRPNALNNFVMQLFGDVRSCAMIFVLVN